MARGLPGVVRHHLANVENLPKVRTIQQVSSEQPLGFSLVKVVIQQAASLVTNFTNNNGNMNRRRNDSSRFLISVFSALCLINSGQLSQADYRCRSVKRNTSCPATLFLILKRHPEFGERKSRSVAKKKDASVPVCHRVKSSPCHSMHKLYGNAHRSFPFHCHCLPVSH